MRNILPIVIVVMAAMSAACSSEPKVVYMQAPASTLQSQQAAIQAASAAAYQAAAQREATEALHRENLRLAAELEAQRMQGEAIAANSAARMANGEAATLGFIAGAATTAVLDRTILRGGYRGYSTSFGHPGWNPHFTLPTDRGYPASSRQPFNGRRR